MFGDAIAEQDSEESSDEVEVLSDEVEVSVVEDEPEAEAAAVVDESVEGSDNEDEPGPVEELSNGDAEVVTESFNTEDIDGEEILVPDASDEEYEINEPVESDQLDSADEIEVVSESPDELVFDEEEAVDYDESADDELIEVSSKSPVNDADGAEAAVGQKTILVVDDNPTIRKLISGKLEKSGHRTVCAVDGIDAIDKLDDLRPDLVLLDIAMPRMDGYQVCKLIRENESTKGRACNYGIRKGWIL